MNVGKTKMVMSGTEEVIDCIEQSPCGNVGKGLGLTLCVGIAHSVRSGYMGDARKWKR